MIGAIACWAAALVSDALGWRWLAGLALGAGLGLTAAWWPQQPDLMTIITAIRPEAAFLSVWLLVLLPILDRRLDREVILGHLWQGGVALAAVALSLGAALQLATVLPDPPALVLLCLSPLYFAGLALCRPGQSWVSWACPAWVAGWLALAASALPDLGLPLGEHGLGMLMMSYGPAVLLRHGFKRQGAVRWLWWLGAMVAAWLPGLALTLGL